MRKVTAPSTRLLAAIRRVLLGKEAISRGDLRADLEARGVVKSRRSDDVRLSAALAALEADGEIRMAGDNVTPVDLQLRSRRPRPHEANGRTLLGQIRKMLRENPVMERAELRERLRAMGKISVDGDGGRKVYRKVHYLERCGELAVTPTHAIAVELKSPPKRAPAKRRGPEGPRSMKIRMMKEREAAFEKRSKRAAALRAQS